MSIYYLLPTSQIIDMITEIPNLAKSIHEGAPHSSLYESNESVLISLLNYVLPLPQII